MLIFFSFGPFSSTSFSKPIFSFFPLSVYFLCHAQLHFYFLISFSQTHLFLLLPLLPLSYSFIFFLPYLAFLFVSSSSYSKCIVFLLLYFFFQFNIYFLLAFFSLFTSSSSFLSSFSTSFELIFCFYIFLFENLLLLLFSTTLLSFSIFLFLFLLFSFQAHLVLTTASLSFCHSFFFPSSSSRVQLII